MIKMFSTMAVTGLMALAMSGVSQAQERTFRKMTSGCLLYTSRCV